MTVKDIAKVMGNQFIAIKTKGEIKWCGGANNFDGWLEDLEVVEIIAPKRETSATVIVAESSLPTWY